MQSATLFAYVGIDIGTGSTKAVALNHSVEVIASAQFYYPTISPQAGFSEQDPDMILHKGDIAWIGVPVDL